VESFSESFPELFPDVGKWRDFRRSGRSTLSQAVSCKNLDPKVKCIRVNDIHEEKQNMYTGDKDDAENDDGGTLLHQAVVLDVHELANLLTLQEFDVDAKDNNGKTPLHLAAAEGWKDEAIKILLSYGANINAKDNNGETPLHIVARSHDIFSIITIPFFVSEGADIHARDNTGRTPLHSAAQESKFKVEFLVSQGADIHAKDEDGHTPLDVAAHHKKTDAMSFLISAGASIHTNDNQDRTPLHWAAWKVEDFVSDGTYVNANKLLVLHGADVNAKDKNGRTPLHYAVLANNLEVVKFFVSQGADAHAKTNDGKTPFDTAEENGNTAITKYLSKQGCGSGIPSGYEFEENSTVDTVDLTNEDDIDSLLNGAVIESLDQKTITEIKSYLRQANRLIKKALRKLED